MISEWIHKIEQDADLQVLMALAGGGLLVFVVVLIIIIVRNIRKRKKAQQPVEPLEIKVQSTHLPENEENDELKESALEIENQKEEIFISPLSEDESHQATSVPAPISEDNIESNPIKSEAQTISNQVKSDTIEEKAPQPIAPTTSVNESSMEDKKREILKAIEQTRSREENLRLLEERLRELREEKGIPEESPQETTQKAPIENKNQDSENAAFALPFESPDDTEINETSTEEENEIEYQEPFHPDFDSIIEESEYQEVLMAEKSMKINDHIESLAPDNIDETEEVISVADSDIETITEPYIQESPESPEQIPALPSQVQYMEAPQPSVPISRTFSEWLTTLSGNKK